MLMHGTSAVWSIATAHDDVSGVALHDGTPPIVQSLDGAYPDARYMASRSTPFSVDDNGVLVL